MKHLKHFEGFISESMSVADDIFFNLVEEYSLGHEKEGQYKLILSRNFEDDPIIIDDKFLGIINTTNKKVMNSDIYLKIACRIDYIDYNNGVEYECKVIIGTLERVINWFTKYPNMTMKKIVIVIEELP